MLAFVFIVIFKMNSAQIQDVSKNKNQTEDISKGNEKIGDVSKMEKKEQDISIKKEQKEDFSQETIIKDFNNNYAEFKTVAEYLKTNHGVFQIEYIKGNWSIYYESNGSIKKISIDDIGISGKLMFLVNSLDYVGIYQDDIEIRLVHKSHNYERGVIYQKDGKTPAGVIKTVLIKDKWYYYERRHDGEVVVK